MSAINVFQYPDGAAVWSDAAHYLADGTLGAAAPKIEPLPHLNAVLAVRGPSLFLPLLAHRMAQAAESFDEAVTILAQEAHRTLSRHKELFVLCTTGIHFDVVLVGWSEARARCETWVLFSEARGEQAAWTPHEMGPVVLMPYDDGLGDRLDLTDAQLAGALHPIEDGLRIIEAQRGVTACQGGREEPSHGVGGFAQMTLVGRDRIETRVMRRWPDPIGEKLGSGPKIELLGRTERAG